MKYLISLFLLISFLDVNAQVTNNDVIPLLCHKWRAIQMIAGQMKIDVPADGDYTLFKSDFTHVQKQEGTIRNGTWKYVESTKKLIFASGDEYILKEISVSKLVLTTKMEGKSVDLVFKHFDE